MKKLIAVFLCLCITLSFAACGKTEEEALSDTKQAFADFKADVDSQYIVAVNARVAADGNGRIGLTADIKNTMSGEIEISELVIAIAAWDVSGVPVIIKTEKNPDSTSYTIEMATEDDVIIADGGIWAADQGIYLSEDCTDVAYVEAIAVSGIICGEDWNNPCYDAWKETYNGVILESWQREDMTNYSTDGEILSSDITDDDDTDTPDSSLAFSEFYEYLLSQEMVALNAGANLQEDGRTGLMTDIKNNMVADATEISVAFAMWDEDGDPLLIQSASGLTEDSYVKEANMGDLMVEGYETWTADMGMFVANERSTIAHVEAIVVSCKLNGSDWTNPMYDMWKEFFGGKTLEDEILDTINGGSVSESEAN